MTRIELLALIKSKAAKSKKLFYVSSGFADSPFVSNFATLNKQHYTACYYTIYQYAANPQIHYLTVLAYYENSYILKCGDAYLEGKMNDETVRKLVKQTLDQASADALPTLGKQMHQSYGVAPRSSACNFNQKNYELANTPCEHIAQFLQDIPPETLDKLAKQYHMHLHGVSAGDGMDPKLSKLFGRYAFKKHLLLEGEKGSGKTHHATLWGKTRKIEQLFIGGHEQFESIDFLGHYIQQKSGELVWKDGALTQAFRKAQQGTKTILVIDEILRIPKRELNILISALSPIGNSYVLRTGRAKEVVDAIAREETIAAPTKNLWVIGTTNMGAGYAVEEMDEALMDRFKPVRKDTTEHELRQILMSTAEEREYSFGIVEKLMMFYSKMTHLQKSGILSKIVNIRHLNESLQLSNNEQEVLEVIKDSRLLWVDRDYHGYPVKEQMDAIDTLLSKVWNAG